MGSGNGLLPDGTMPFPAQKMTSHLLGSLELQWEQFHSKSQATFSIMSLNIIYSFEITATSHRGQWDHDVFMCYALLLIFVFSLYLLVFLCVRVCWNKLIWYFNVWQVVCIDMPLKRGQFSAKSSQNTSRSSPVRASKYVILGLLRCMGSMKALSHLAH